MGNMILLKTEIKHSGPLGLDDFPTNLTVTCDFDRGKPRDQYGVEAIYMNGNDRIYHGMSDKIFDAYKAAEIYKKGKDDGNASWIDYDKEGTKVYKYVDPEATKPKPKANSATNKKEQEKQKEQQTETSKTTTKTTSKDKNAKPDGKKETKKETGKTTNKATGQQAENKPGQENKTTKADKDAETTAGSQAQAPAPEINIPGESLEELNARFKENEVISAQALLKMGDSSIIKETFGDPDAFVILYTSKEQQEGSSMKMVQEDPATANTGGSASKSEQS